MKLAYAPTSFFPQHRDPNKQAKTKTRNEHEPWAPTYGPVTGVQISDSKTRESVNKNKSNGSIRERKTDPNPPYAIDAAGSDGERPSGPNGPTQS